MEIPAPPPSAQPADPAQAPQATQAAVASSGPNASPLDLFPQVLPPFVMWSTVSSFK
jgi:UV excision repair protein RAD23